MQGDSHDNLARRVKLRELRLLLSVADNGSFHGAARASHMSQPAITNAVASLESALGVRLFERTPKGVQPTPSGTHLILRARAIFGELKLALEELDTINADMKRVLHIGSVPLPASGILPVALEQIHREHADIAVSVLEASEQVLQAALKARRIDLYFSRLSRDAKDPALQFEELYGDTLHVIANKKHPLAREKNVSFASLAKESWVLPPAGSFFHDHIQRVLTKAGHPLPRPAIETLSGPIMHGLIVKGPYIGFSTRSVYRYNPIKPLIAKLDLTLPDVTASVGVVSLKDRPIDPSGQLLVERVRALAR